MGRGSRDGEKDASWEARKARRWQKGREDEWKKGTVSEETSWDMDRGML